MARHPAGGHHHRVDVPHHPSEAHGQQHSTQRPRDRAVPSHDTTVVTPTAAFLQEAASLKILSRPRADEGRVIRHLWVGRARASQAVRDLFLPPSLCGAHLALTGKQPREGKMERVHQA